MEEPKKIYAAAGIYIASIYLSWIGFFQITAENGRTNGAGMSGDWLNFMIILPIIVGILVHIWMKKNKNDYSRSQLRKAAVIVKCALIPVYIVGALLIVMFFFLMLTPVVFMIFVSPMVIGFLNVMGWIYLILGNTFSFAFLNRARDDGTISALGCKVAKFFHIFFVTDVIALFIMAGKDKAKRELI